MAAVPGRCLSLSPECGLPLVTIFYSVYDPDPLAAGGVGCGPAQCVATVGAERQRPTQSETLILTHVKC